MLHKIYFAKIIRRKSNGFVMRERYIEPLYTIGVTARMLKVCLATLRIWEKKGLIKPARLGKNRFYSRCDVNRLENIKKLLRIKRINIQGVKSILSEERCWEIKKCKTQDKKKCPVYRKYNSK